MSRETAELFDHAARIADAAMLVPSVGTVAKVASLAFRAAKAFAEAGKDPVVEIKRMLSVVNEVAKVNDEFEAAINREFARRAERLASPPPPPFDDDETPPTPPATPSSIGARATEPSMPAVTDEDLSGFTPEDI